ncbi:MAG: hypothetical protein A3K65_03695 [Euryarchaeota archaeon RBG_16_68_12]|nr:MAG: hypothetical protein A3K65_03695 [Euryarchaeota archaeon RBG_16_68_12]
MQAGEGARPFVAAAVALAFLAFLAGGLSAPVSAATAAPDFSLVDVDGIPLNLTLFRGKILLLDFMYINCASCEIARPVVERVYARHHGNGTDDVIRAISIDIYPTDSEAALRIYRNEKGILWHLAKDTDTVQQRYAVVAVVRLFLIDQSGYFIFDKEGMSATEGAALEADLENTIAAAVRGNAPVIDVQLLSIYALAALAAVGSFFSPCSFPMFPGYMAFFLGIDAKNPGQMSKGRAVASGTISAVGIILVYGLIALALLGVGAAAAAVVPALQPIVGALLIFMGALMFTAVQFNWIVNPFRALRRKLLPNWTPQAAQTTTAKLFAYGVGYGAAGFGCVAPPFIAAVLNGVVIGGIGMGLLVLLVYAGIVLSLMAAITLILATLGKAAIDKINRYTETIKKISAVVLIIAGAYLIWYWYSAWVAS